MSHCQYSGRQPQSPPLAAATIDPAQRQRHQSPWHQGTEREYCRRRWSISQRPLIAIGAVWSKILQHVSAHQARLSPLFRPPGRVEPPWVHRASCKGPLPKNSSLCGAELHTTSQVASQLIGMEPSRKRLWHSQRCLVQETVVMRRPLGNHGGQTR